MIVHLLTWKKYCGVRSCNVAPNEDLGFIYISSSTDVDFKIDQKQNPTDYWYFVIDTFKTREIADKEEENLHKLYDVATNPGYYNKYNSRASGFNTLGRVRPQKERDNISKRQLSFFNDPEFGLERRERQRIGALKSNEIIRKDTVRYQNKLKKISEANSGGKHPLAELVYKIDPKTNTIIEKFDYIKLAADRCGINYAHLTTCINAGKECNGFLWETPHNNYKYTPREHVRGKKHFRAKKVKQLDRKTLEVIRTWDSMIEATLFLNNGKKSTQISECINGRQNFAFGYKWTA